MKSSILYSLSICVVALVGASDASARNLSNGISAREVADALEARGYPAVIGTDSVGDPKISSKVGKTNFYVYFYSCSGRCAAIQFSVGYDFNNGMALASSNLWSRKYRFGKVYLDDESDPFMQMDVDLRRGGTSELVETNVDRYVSLIKDFETFVGWVPA